MDLTNDPDIGQAKTGPRGKAAERILAAEQLAELRELRLTMTKLAAHLAGRAINNTLLVETVLLDSTAAFSRDFHVAAGSVRVTNPSAANTVTVHAAPGQGYTPQSGVGVALVPPGQTRTIALGSRNLTVYGTAADRVTIEVYTTGAAPLP